MNTSADFAKSPAENAGVLVSALGADISGGDVASIITLPEKSSFHSARTVKSDARRSRGIPELDSPMAG